MPPPASNNLPKRAPIGPRFIDKIPLIAKPMMAAIASQSGNGFLPRSSEISAASIPLVIASLFTLQLRPMLMVHDNNTATSETMINTRIMPSPARPAATQKNTRIANKRAKPEPIQTNPVKNRARLVTSSPPRAAVLLCGLSYCSGVNRHRATAAISSASQNQRLAMNFLSKARVNPSSNC